jgi:hypothetical protein
VKIRIKIGRRRKEKRGDKDQREDISLETQTPSFGSAVVHENNRLSSKENKNDTRVYIFEQFKGYKTDSHSVKPGGRPTSQSNMIRA